MMRTIKVYTVCTLNITSHGIWYINIFVNGMLQGHEYVCRGEIPYLCVKWLNGFRNGTEYRFIGDKMVMRVHW